MNCALVAGKKYEKGGEKNLQSLTRLLNAPLTRSMAAVGFAVQMTRRRKAQGKKL